MADGGCWKGWRHRCVQPTVSLFWLEIFYPHGAIFVCKMSDKPFQAYSSFSEPGSVVSSA